MEIPMSFQFKSLDKKKGFFGPISSTNCILVLVFPQKKIGFIPSDKYTSLKCTLYLKSNAKMLANGINFAFKFNYKKKIIHSVNFYTFFLIHSLMLITPQGHKKKRGELHLMLQVSTSDQEHSQLLDHHKRLLKIFLTHELLAQKSAPYEWRDEFCLETLQILTQHAVQGRMSRLETAASRWQVYCMTHAILPLDYRVFTPILEKIRMYIHTKFLSG